MPARTPSERALVARLAAHESWAKTPDRTARTQPGRDALRLKFEQQVDPDGTLAPDERARRAEHARKAYFTRLALKSAQSRRKAAALTAEAEAAEAELSAVNAAGVAS